MIDHGGAIKTITAFYAPISHVAVADMKATYGAYVDAGNSTCKKTNNGDQDAKNKSNHATCSNYKYSRYFLRGV